VHREAGVATTAPTPTPSFVSVEILADDVVVKVGRAVVEVVVISSTGVRVDTSRVSEGSPAASVTIVARIMFPLKFSKPK